MSPVTTQSQEEDEDFLEESAGEEVKRQPAVSDSRRRRLRAQGIETEAPDESTANAITPSKGRPTPSREGEVRRTNIVSRVIEGIREYVHDVRSELGKVTWLTRPELTRLVNIVLAVVVVSAIFLGLLSFLFGSVISAMTTASSAVPAGLAVIALVVIVTAVWLLRERLFPSLDE
jgi:preprotein translocase subunit SecE